MNSDWYEIWVDDGATLPYILIVMPQETQDGRVRILDPKEGNRVIHEAGDYEAAKLWLLEDEYHKVGDRIVR
jgi:hypothetical protein